MVTYTAAVFTAATPVAAPRSGGGALSEGRQTALHSLLGTLPTSGAPCGPAAGDAGGRRADTRVAGVDSTGEARRLAPAPEAAAVRAARQKSLSKAY